MSAIAAPYWLLAGGILVLIVGYLIAAGSGSSSTFIDHRMSDEEIARQLEDQNRGNPIAGLLIMLGYLAIFVSVVWRIIRKFS